MLNLKQRIFLSNRKVYEYLSHSLSKRISTKSECRRMAVTFCSPIAAVLMCAVIFPGSCAVAQIVSDKKGYSHVGCYYEVYMCASPPYYIEYQRVNVPMFDVCLEFTQKKGFKYFGVQAKDKSDCITGPNIQTPQKADCLKNKERCYQDKAKLSFYSYDLYIIKDVASETPPKVLRSPSNQTSDEKESVEISCEFGGKPFPTLTWKKNGQVIDFNSQQSNKMTHNVTRNENTGTAVLRIFDLRIEDEGYYTCTMENKINATTSEQGYLKVRFLHDVIIQTPNPYSLTLGQKTASLRCHGVGFPRPVLWWYKEGISVSQINRIRIVSSNVSSTNVSSQLFLTTSEGVSCEEAGNYTCVAYSNALNKTARRTVEVLFKPQIHHKPTDQVALQGTQTSYYCNATGVPEPTISWGFSGGSLPQHSRSGNKIVIQGLKNTDKYEGSYICIASNRAGKIKASATLTVDVPPTQKAAFPKGVILQLGETLRLKCDVYGDPGPSFQWTRGKIKSEKTILPDQSNYQLVIKDVRVKDAAYYGCSATNRVGAVTMDAVFVDVDTSLDIINRGENFTAITESNVTIKCIASSEITPEIKMIKNDVELQTVTKVSDDKRVVTAEFTVRSVTTDDSGPYTCVAKNRQKSVQDDVALVVEVPIKIDMDVTLQDETFTEELKNKSSEKYQNLSVAFVQEMTKLYINETGFERVEVLGFSNGSVAVRFRVVFKVKVQKPEEKPPPDTKVRMANVVVRKVKESDGLVGKFKIKPDSVKPLVKPPSPRNLTAINIKKRELTVIWKHPLFHENYGVKRYVVMYKAFGSSWKKIDVGSKHVNRFILEDLEADTRYSIRTHAISHLGQGLPSNVVETKTLSAFWETFAKVFIPLIIIIIIIVIIVLIYLRRRRLQKKKHQKGKDEHRYKEHLIKEKKMVEEDVETIELPKRWKEIPRDSLVLDKELGSGQFGVVFKGFLKEKGEEEEVPCAVKMLKPNASQEAKRDLSNELEIMASVDVHPNIVNLIGACTEKDGPLYVIVEFAQNGCLLDYLRKNRMSFAADDEKLEEVSSLRNQEKIRIAFEVATGMQHLAKFRCVHRDLAARNVLLGKDRIAKVADFGLARDVYEQGFYEKSSTGGKLPAKWMSIEALETLKATTESDVWSFGVLLWEIETGGKMPYGGFSINEILKSLKSGARLPKPANCSQEVYSVMRECWEANPSKRPTFGDLSQKLDNLFIHFLED